MLAAGGAVASGLVNPSLEALPGDDGDITDNETATTTQHEPIAAEPPTDEPRDRSTSRPTATDYPNETAVAMASSVTFEYRPHVDYYSDTVAGSQLSYYGLDAMNDKEGFVLITMETPEQLDSEDIEVTVDSDGSCGPEEFWTAGWYRGGSSNRPEHVETNDFMFVYTGNESCMVSESNISVVWDSFLGDHAVVLGEYRVPETPEPTTSNASHITPDYIRPDGDYGNGMEGARFGFYHENANEYGTSPYNMTVKILGPNGVTLQQTKSFEGRSRNHYIKLVEDDDSQLTEEELHNSSFQMYYEDELVWELDGCESRCEYE